jgi:hypothetical protein
MCRRGVACPKRSTTLLIDTIRSWRQVPHRASICQPASSPIGVRAKDDGLQSVSCAQDAVSRTARKPAAASATAKCEPVPTTMRGQPPPTRAAATLIPTALDVDPLVSPSATGGLAPWTPTGVPPASQFGIQPICDAGGTPVGVQGGETPCPPEAMPMSQDQ